MRRCVGSVRCGEVGCGKVVCSEAVCGKVGCEEVGCGKVGVSVMRWGWPIKVYCNYRRIGGFHICIINALVKMQTIFMSFMFLSPGQV